MLALWLTFASASVTAAQPDSSAAARYRHVVQTSPIGFLQVGPTLEAVTLVEPNFAFSAGMRFPSFGLIPRAIAESEDDALNFSWAVGIALLYQAGPGLGGWHGGPRFEFGRGGSVKYVDRGVMVSAEFGRRWIHRSGYALSVGAMAGAAWDSYRSRTNPYDVGTDLYPLAMLLLNFGWAY